MTNLKFIHIQILRLCESFLLVNDNSDLANEKQNVLSLRTLARNGRAEHRIIIISDLLFRRPTRI